MTDTDSTPSPKAMARLIEKIARAHLGGRTLDEAADAILKPLRKAGDIPHYTLTTERRLKTIARLAKAIRSRQESKVS